MITPALRKIEASLRRLADDGETPIDHHEIRVVAMQVGAQIEMIELGLATGANQL